MILNRTRVGCSFDFEITCIISDQIVLHSVQLPLFVMVSGMASGFTITINHVFVEIGSNVE